MVGGEAVTMRWHLLLAIKRVMRIESTQEGVRAAEWR